MSLDTSTEVPGPPPISIQLPSCPSSFGKHFAPSQAPTLDPGSSSHLSYGRLRDMCQQHGYHRRDAKEAWETPLPSMRDKQVSSTQDVRGKLAIPITGTGKKGRPGADVTEYLQSPTFVPDKRVKQGSGLHCGRGSRDGSRLMVEFGIKARSRGLAILSSGRSGGGYPRMGGR